MKTKTVTYYTDFESYDELINFLDSSDFIYKPTLKEYLAIKKQEHNYNWENNLENKPEFDESWYIKNYENSKIYFYGKYNFIANFEKTPNYDLFSITYCSSCKRNSKNHWCKKVVVDTEGNISISKWP